MESGSDIDQDLVTRIAIVEDNAALREYLADVIGFAPAHRCVCACRSAEEAIVQIPPLRPHIVLMDIHLPGESGVACTARLRGKLPNVQILVLTVYQDIKMIFRGLQAGACGYVLKRAQDADILKAIAEVRAGGALMTAEIARMVVRSFLGQGTPGGASGAHQLTDREMEILGQFAEGWQHQEIASRLGFNHATMRAQLLHIYDKLHERWQAEAAAKYIRADALGAVGQRAAVC